MWQPKGIGAFHENNNLAIFSLSASILLPLIMKTLLKLQAGLFGVLSLVSLGYAQTQEDLNFAGPAFNFNCPEKNGLFADPQQCDLFHVCVDGQAKAELCPDGLLFDDSDRNKERCKLPYTVDCGDRGFVQERQAGIDPVCEHANGYFDHDDPTVCDRYYLCDKGKAFDQPCSPTTVFDNKYGVCVIKGTESETAKLCGTEEEQLALKTIEGFTCPGKETIGPNGLVQAHPIFPHPTDCQFFFTCFFGREPNKFGCTKGQVFDATTLTCKTTEEVPDCSCWYDCGENSRCPDSCNADCTCPAE